MSELQIVKGVIGGYYLWLDGKQIGSMPSRGEDNTDLAKELKCRWSCHDDLVAACEAEEKARKYIGSTEIARKLYWKAADLRRAALAKVKKNSQ